MDSDNIALKHEIAITDEQYENQEQQNMLPNGFVYVNDIIPSIRVELKYATIDNFTGMVVPGYNSNKAIGTKAAAEALKSVQNELNSLGLSLKIFDFYRPHRACRAFKSWCLNHEDEAKFKKRFYPNIEKEMLLQGYIAEYSKHSRGSAVDLTIVSLETGKELDMGTEFDFFGEESHTHSELISKSARANRQVLIDVMDKHGFDNYRKEWWHFELRDEPFTQKPQHHFDFIVK